MYLDRPQIILTPFSMFLGQFGTRNCPVNEASMNFMILLGDLTYIHPSCRIFPSAQSRGEHVVVDGRRFGPESRHSLQRRIGQEVGGAREKRRHVHGPRSARQEIAQGHLRSLPGQSAFYVRAAPAGGL